ncbi:Fumarate hydratase (Fumerase) [compost metagenome]
MGFGGEVTLLGCKIGAMNRLPASFFVSVAYNCWAFRRQGIEMDSVSGEIGKWLYPVGTEVPVSEKKSGESKKASSDSESGANEQGAREIVLRTPISEEQIRSLRVGDVVVIQGEMHTGVMLCTNI